MATPYSDDLRTKAIEAVERGGRESSVCRTLNISRNTLDLWLKRKLQTGDYHVSTDYQKGTRHKITDWKKFRTFAQHNQGKTQAQMAKLWGNGVTQCDVRLINDQCIEVQ
jgi:transposase